MAERGAARGKVAPPPRAAWGRPVLPRLPGQGRGGGAGGGALAGDSDARATQALGGAKTREWTRLIGRPGETVSDWSAPRGRPLRRRETGTRKGKPPRCVGLRRRLSRQRSGLRCAASLSRFPAPRRTQFRRLQLLIPARTPRTLHALPTCAP